MPMLHARTPSAVLRCAVLLCVAAGALATNSGSRRDSRDRKDRDDRSCYIGNACPYKNCYQEGIDVRRGHDGYDGWTVSIPNCHIPEREDNVAYIAWGPVGDHGRCSEDCIYNKAHADKNFTIDIHIPYGACVEDPICIYIFDEKYVNLKNRIGRHDAPDDVPSSCLPTGAKTCHSCEPFIVKPKLPTGTECDDKVSCTTYDVCKKDGKCEGKPDDYKCDDGVGCTSDVCKPGRSADKNGCVNEPWDQFCEDRVSDLKCVESVCKPDRMKSYGDYSGCVDTPKDRLCDPPKCAEASCSLEKGCVFTEKMKRHDKYCWWKNGCHGSVCAAASYGYYSEGYYPRHHEDKYYKKHGGGDGYYKKHGGGDGYYPKHDGGDGYYPKHDGGDGYYPKHDGDDGYYPKHDGGDGYYPKHDGDGHYSKHDGDEHYPKHDSEEHYPKHDSEEYYPHHEGEGYYRKHEGEGYYRKHEGEGYYPHYEGEGYYPHYEGEGYYPHYEGEGHYPQYGEGHYPQYGVDEHGCTKCPTAY